MLPCKRPLQIIATPALANGSYQGGKRLRIGGRYVKFYAKNRFVAGQGQRLTGLLRVKKRHFLHCRH